MSEPSPHEVPAPVESAEHPGESLRRHLKRGEEFIEKILNDNERLRLRIVQLENRMEQELTPVPPPLLAAELRQLFQSLFREHADLHRRLEDIAAETSEYKNRYREIEEENDRLVNLFVATHQLHSGMDLPGAVQIIVEILLNFVGAGRFALLVLDEPSQTLQPLETYGLPRASVPSRSLADPALAEIVASGRPFVAPPLEGSFSVDHPRVLIPLRRPDGFFGMVAIYSFLTQKEEISAVDRELFTLISDHAGTVLEAAWLLTAAARPPRTAAALLALMPSASEP
jgi:hypothetical protein